MAPSLCSDPEGVDLESSDPHFGVIRMSPLEVIDRRWAGAKAGPSSLAAISLCMLHFADYAWGLWEVEILFIYFICLLFMCLGTHVEVRGQLVGVDFLLPLCGFQNLYLVWSAPLWEL